MVLTHASDRHRHAALAVAVEAGLGTVGGVEDVDGLARSGGKPPLLRLAAELREGAGGVGRTRLPLQAREDGHGVAVADRHPVHGGGDREAGGNERLAVEAPQDAAGLRFDLLLLAPADVGHHVVGHVHGGDPGVARARE